MQFSDEILNSIATGLPEVKSPRPPLLSADRGSLVEYVLNITFHQIRDDQWRIFDSAYIPRSIAARAAYRSATSCLNEYVAGLPTTHKLHRFRDAIEEFERCIHDARVAMDLVRHMEAKAKGSKNPKEFVYKKNDNSAEDRLAKMDNRAKHFAEDIFGGDVRHPTPIWLSNQGLICSQSELSFVELAQLLEDLGDNLAFIARDSFHIK